MHGRGRETLANGEVFIVYHKNGKKLETLAYKQNIIVMNPNISLVGKDSFKVKHENKSFVLAKNH